MEDPQIDSPEDSPEIKPMIAIAYRLRAEMPLLTTGLGGDANTKRSMSYLPGSALRGALIERYLEQRGRSRLRLEPQPGEENPEQRLFFSSAVSYLPAYPVVVVGGEEVRGLPTPLSWRRDKAAEWKPGAGVFDLAVGGSDGDAGQTLDPNIQYIAPDGAYCRLERHFDEEGHPGGGYVFFKTPPRRIRIHTARARSAGRATQDDGAIFQYDALAEGERFAGIILAETEADAEQILALLQAGDLWVGGSRRAGYGQVSVEEAELDPYWLSETGSVPEEVAAGDLLRLTALSPWLLRTPQGHPALDLDPAQVASLFKLDPAALEPLPAQTQRAPLAVGGFNLAWGLPMPQRTAIAAGSTFVFRTQRPISADLLWQLQNHGLGERRSEGFGRVAVNWQTTPQLIYQEGIRDGYRGSEPDLREQPSHYAALTDAMARRILRRELEPLVTARIRYWRLAQPAAVQNSLLNRLRMAVREALAGFQQLTEQALAQKSPAELDEEYLAALRKLLKGLKPTAANQLHRAHLRDDNGPSLHTWLTGRLQGADGFWDSEIAAPSPLTFGKIKTTAPEAWKVEYTLRLIDGVLAQAARPKGVSS